jgi:hypothetical protein
MDTSSTQDSIEVIELFSLAVCHSCVDALCQGSEGSWFLLRNFAACIAPSAFSLFNADINIVVTNWPIFMKLGMNIMPTEIRFWLLLNCILSPPFCQQPLYVLPFIWEAKFHTHTRQGGCDGRGHVARMETRELSSKSVWNLRRSEAQMGGWYRVVTNYLFNFSVNYTKIRKRDTHVHNMVAPSMRWILISV